MDSPPARFTRDYRLAAKPSELGDARAHVDRAAEAFGLSPTERSRFVLAANEAVTNAIRHGTPDRAGAIRVHITADAERLTVAVYDCGPFVPRTARADELAEHGRGFDLMARMVDEVELRAEPDGTMVRLSQRRRPPVGRAEESS